MLSRESARRDMQWAGLDAEVAAAEEAVREGETLAQLAEYASPSLLRQLAKTWTPVPESEDIVYTLQVADDCAWAALNGETHPATHEASCTCDGCWQGWS